MPDPNRPETYKRRILLGVTGLSPQVVTETIYALAVERKPPFIPTDIRLITTRLGAEYLRLDLLSEDPGWFHRLRKDWDLPPIAFNEDSIRIIPDAEGKPADDIRTPEDNERAADFITETVRELTSDPEAALHVSMAGGRKTMGYYVGYALSLFGRSQDRLSHVLVAPPFESHPQFFYPTPRQCIIHALDKLQTPLDCSKAQVTLAEIPFVSLRHGLDQRLLEGGARFSEAVEAARRNLAPPDLVIDLEHRRIRAAGQIIRLQPSLLALLSVFARRAMAGEEPLPAPNKHVHDPEWARRYLKEYRAIRNNPMDDMERTERTLRQGMDGEYFSTQKSKLHKKLRDILGPAASPYLIDSDIRTRRYRLNLPPDAIRYGPLEADDKLAT